MVLKKGDMWRKNRTITYPEMCIIVKSKIIRTIIPGPCPKEIMIAKHHCKIKAAK